MNLEINTSPNRKILNISWKLWVHYDFGALLVVVSGNPLLVLLSTKNFTSHIAIRFVQGLDLCSQSLVSFMSRAIDQSLSINNSHH